jgi:hypothetical protein
MKVRSPLTSWVIVSVSRRALHFGNIYVCNLKHTAHGGRVQKESRVLRVMPLNWIRIIHPLSIWTFSALILWITHLTWVYQKHVQSKGKMVPDRWSMYLSTTRNFSLKNDSCSSWQQLNGTFWNMKVYYHIHKNSHRFLLSATWTQPTTHSLRSLKYILLLYSCMGFNFTRRLVVHKHTFLDTVKDCRLTPQL